MVKFPLDRVFIIGSFPVNLDADCFFVRLRHLRICLHRFFIRIAYEPVRRQKHLDQFLKIIFVCDTVK